MNGDIDTMTEKEQFFFSLFNNLLEDGTHELAYIFDSDRNLKLEYYITGKYLYLSEEHFYEPFRNKFHCFKEKTIFLFREMMEKHLGFDLTGIIVEFV